MKKIFTKNVIIFLLSIFVSVIIWFMADLTWGALAKNQTDSQLITEAITEAINSHEADPTAHLGDGESLQQHKSNEVIDHLAGSIVPDKINGFQKFNFPTLAYNLIDEYDNVSVSSNPITLGVGQVGALSGDGYAKIFQIVPTDEGYAGGDIIFDFRFLQTQAVGTAQGRFNFGFASIEFKKDYYRLRYFNAGWHDFGWVSHTGSWNQHWRVSYSAIDNKLYFYLNDVEVGSVAGAVYFEDGYIYLTLYLNRGTSSEMTLLLSNFSYYISS